MIDDMTMLNDRIWPEYEIDRVNRDYYNPDDYFEEDQNAFRRIQQLPTTIWLD